MAATTSTPADVAPLPKTIFSSETCLTRGYCEVSKTRTPKSHKLYYEIHGPRNANGDKDPSARLVFIMGLNNSCFGWHNQIRHFGPKAGFRSLVVDNRGVGLSDVPSGVYKTSEMACDLHELLDHVGWTEARSLHVVGVSMGGMIAQELATLIPDRIASLVLTSTTAGNTRDVAPLPALKMFSKLMFVRNSEAMVRIVIDGLYPVAWLEAPDSQTGQGTNRDRITKEFLHRHSITRQQTLAGRLYQTYAALGHYLSPERLLQISKVVPKIAILTGDLDEIIDPQRSRDLERFLPGGEYVLFEGGGHAIVSQFSDRYNATLERIVAEAQSRVSSSTRS